MSLPHGHQHGRGPHGAGEGDRQVPPAAVAQRQLDLDVLQGADVFGPPRAGGGVRGDGELGADLPARYEMHEGVSPPSMDILPPTTSQHSPVVTAAAAVQHKPLSCSGHSTTLLQEGPPVRLDLGTRPLPGGMKSFDRTRALRPSPRPRLGHLHQPPGVQQPVAIVVAHCRAGATRERTHEVPQASSGGSRSPRSREGGRTGSGRARSSPLRPTPFAAQSSACR